MKVIVFGAKGMLGGELVRQMEGYTVTALDREEIDVRDKDAVRKIVMDLRPDWIFNCVAYNAVDKAENSPDKERAFELNDFAVGYIAEAAKEINATLIHYSTGFVFDGNSDGGYDETSEPNPISNYGQSKLQGEKKAQSCPKHYVIRLNLLFGKPALSEGGKISFPEMILFSAKEKTEMDFVVDEVSTPTYAVDLVQASIQLVEQKYPFGIYHLPNKGQASWLDYAKEVFRIKNVSIKLNPVTSDSFERAAQRPKNSVIINTKFPELRPWQEALGEYLQNN
ncbi:MAG: dTDP-4-dehydrorhamnose reductase [Candidatus Doudnabacteria bacterium]